MSFVLVIYLCFQIYYLISYHCKTQSELTDMLKNSPNLLNFLQGVLWLSSNINNFSQKQARNFKFGTKKDHTKVCSDT